MIHGWWIHWKKGIEAEKASTEADIEKAENFLILSVLV